MSLIGSLEQFDLANILRRIEVFEKTGLLVVKQQEGLWVEFYFRKGQLVCLGPMRTNATLIDRLLQADLLSLQVLPQVMSIVGSADSNETRLALALINGGFLSREILRAWASQETSQVLLAILAWPAGEIYFEDDCPTPTDRLLVALSVSALLDLLPPPTLRPASAAAPVTDRPAYQPPAQFAPAVTPHVQAGQINASQLPDSVTPFAAPAPVPAPGSFSASQLLEGVQPFAMQAPAPGSFNASQLIEELPFNPSGSLSMAQLVEETPPAAFASSSPSTGFLGAELDITAATQSSLIPPQPVQNPLPPARIDTSFMTPEMVLVASDLSSIRAHNPQVQLTPDQWRVFALIDGQMSLQMLCQMLMAPADQVCVLAGELIAMGLIMPLPQNLPPFNDPSTGARDYGLSGTYPVAQPYPMQQPRSPQITGSMSGPFGGPIETQSQWGNGNNGATFMVGGGWVLSSRQSAPQTGQPGAVYAPVGGQY